ncbi:MAG TPA: hypothetical protein VGL76_04575 [Gaiellaceae bacterium]
MAAVRRPWTRDGLVFLAYAAISFGYFGVRLLPHPGRVMVGSGQDPFIFAWSFAWWPHALLHGTNPFVTHALYAPQGINLTWTTSVPGLAIVFAPLTLAAGPVVAFNTCAILLPALAAWTAYKLCLHLTRSVWASLVGGYLFGFSSFVVQQQLQGHLNLIGVFLLPVVALVVLRYLGGELDTRGLVWRIGLLVAAQLTISTEVTLTLTLAVVVGLVLAAALLPATRARIRAAVVPLLGGYVLAGVVTAPLVAFLLLGFHASSFSGAEISDLDGANFLVPAAQNAFLGGSFKGVHVHFHDVEAGAYLGLPVLLILVLYAWRFRHARTTWLLFGAAFLAAFSALGDVLYLDGHRLITLPWTYARHVPVLDNLRPTRIVLYLALTAAIVVALWIARTSGRVFARPYLLPALAVAALVPAAWGADYTQHPKRWAFFSSSCAKQGQTLVAFPWGDVGPFMLAQAENGFRFRLAEGYLGPLVRSAHPVSSFESDPTVFDMQWLSNEALPTATRLLAFAGSHEIARIAVDRGDSGWPTRGQLAKAGPIEQVSGLLVAPACDRPPLTSRDLSPQIQTIAKIDSSQATTGWCLGTNYFAFARELYPAGILAGAKHADLIAGTGLGCAPPAGYTRQGMATAAMGVTPGTYPYYAPPG